MLQEGGVALSCRRLLMSRRKQDLISYRNFSAAVSVPALLCSKYDAVKLGGSFEVRPTPAENGSLKKGVLFREETAGCDRSEAIPRLNEKQKATDGALV